MSGAGLHSAAKSSRLLLCPVVFAFLAGSLSPAATNNILPYSVRSWQTDDGLPQNSVYAIAQTADGYLWVGTHDGLARFDGMRFALVDDPALPALRHAWVTALCAARDGSLWIGTDGAGAACLRQGALAGYTEEEGLANDQIRCFAEGADGSMWIGTEGGLSRFKDGKFTCLRQADGLGDSVVRALCQDSQGLLRVATRRGLSTVSAQGKVLGTVNFGTNWSGNSLRAVREARDGNLWVGSTDGLDCLRAGQVTVYGPEKGLPDRVINVVFQDRAGQLWVGTYAGLARMLDGKVVERPNREAVFGDLVYAIFEDREDNLWVGARDGLYRLNPARFTTYTTEQGLTRNNVMSVCEDGAGTIWLGIWDGGLNALRDGKVTAYPSPASVPRDSVLSLLAAPDESLWIGMDLNAGLQRFANGRRELVAPSNSPAVSSVRVLQQTEDGALLLGTAAGLNVWKAGNCVAYKASDGLAGDSVMAVVPDRRGGFWVGTEGGLSHWQGGAFTNYTTRDGLSHNSVGALYLAQDGTLWIGTRGGGLNWYHNGKFTSCTMRQGLFSDEIYEVLEDDFGYFWLSCRRGIFRVARRQLEALERGGIKNVVCTVFGKADGLVSVQCNGVAKPAGWKASDGRLWFPTIRGVVAVETRIKTNTKPPPVLIEQVLADRKSLRPASGPGLPQRDTAFVGWGTDNQVLRVRPGRGELELHYTALSLEAPERNLFKYRLEGLDPDWSDPVTQRTVHYYNVSPGTYRFRVIASNNDGVWNETGAAVTLVLAPHLWQTWWFRSAAVLGLALLLTGLYRVRFARVRELERLRIEIAANLHDDVGARLTKVAMVTELVDQETPETQPIKPQIQTISRTTREIIQAMDEVVWTINPKNDTLDNLANYIFLYAQDYFQHTGVRCRLDMPVQLPNRALPTKVRHNLFMAIKEALNNALKHAAATEVRIALAFAEERLTIVITDDGRGFEPDSARGGDGLGNMRERLAQIDGILRLESAPGRGTKVLIEASI